MKNLSFLIICFCIALSATAQVRFSAALGANTGLFVPSSDVSVNYIPKVMPNFNLQMAIKKGESAFSGIVQVNLAPKSIGTKLKGEVNGQSFEEGSAHSLSSGELLLGVAMDFELKNIIIRPHAGIFLALNQVNGFSASSWGTTMALGFDSYESDGTSLFTYLGVNLGCSIVKRMFNDSREAAFFAEVYYAPRNIFETPFNYSWNGNDYSVQGKYHSLNVGIRMDLNRS
jgi:hypothetical protein